MASSCKTSNKIWFDQEFGESCENMFKESLYKSSQLIFIYGAESHRLTVAVSFRDWICPNNFGFIVRFFPPWLGFGTIYRVGVPVGKKLATCFQRMHHFPKESEKTSRIVGLKFCAISTLFSQLKKSEIKRPTSIAAKFVRFGNLQRQHYIIKMASSCKTSVREFIVRGFGESCVIFQ